MSLADPGSKMSKSDPNPNAFIGILDDPGTIVKKFKRAVTDSDTSSNAVRASDDKPGVTNLISIYSAITGKSFEEIENEFTGRGYGDFKTVVGETTAEHLRPIRERFAAFSSDKAYLEECYKKGAEQANRLARRTLDKVYKKIGFIAK